MRIYNLVAGPFLSEVKLGSGSPSFTLRKCLLASGKVCFAKVLHSQNLRLWLCTLLK